ncbi:signal peptidase I [Alicyclobacillus cellulosilyticus]|uniref:Signal peptidase I n=1 Tax=Alicyclobacillus cellulosilyticus TaxID=1003997 RepID=A0A917KER2_9BACL|nr:signal peptidase I [Alicyclobacillus cellulosilyticus]GGJ11511.1 signal peptidase I [Alicyclobacillus cellulosilyticus]
MAGRSAQEERAPRSSSPSVLRVVWNWLWPIAVGAGLAKLFVHYVFSFAEVPTSSMYPTIPNPCFILVDHVATELMPPYRGEVVLFRWPDDPKTIFVKRIIGLPGDTVWIGGGRVYINGRPLAEPYLSVPTLGTFGPYKVPPDSYFMMGDNRNRSDDSRLWTHKFVPRSSIIGRADLVIWPLWKAKVIEQ